MRTAPLIDDITLLDGVGPYEILSRVRARGRSS
jgi:hypothetical protein